jgi:hypothetical protein
MRLDGDSPVPTRPVTIHPLQFLYLDWMTRARNRMNLTIQKKRKTKWHGDDISSIGTQTNTK